MDRIANNHHALPPPDGVSPAPQGLFKSLQGAYFLGYVPRAVALLCAGENPLTVAWHMPVNKKPFIYAVAIAKDNYSHKLIQEGSDFTLNFISVEYLEDMLIAGKHRGGEVNKWQLFKKLKPLKALTVEALMVEQAMLIYECKKERILDFPDHSLLIGRVELLHYRKGKLKVQKVRYPLHMGKRYFSENSRVYIYK
ncbi:MAG: flavin reductase family protein [Aquificaceae bacterium]|nr:flavin reductase family protein [Aquificaceae bacterium]MDW8295145.1 flavin reductase family protein [Aquificaceae bacterium]